MSHFLQQPSFKYVFTLRNGGTIYAEPNDVRKTLDKRFSNAPPQRVFEVRVNGIWQMLWPEDILRWDQEAI